MGAIRASGLASGLDTNSIVEQLVATAKEPIHELENQSYLVGLEKALYKDINNDLTVLKNAAFTLKMESTFKSKVVSSSDKGVASATVSASASKGSHTIEVLQTARNSFLTSKYLTTSIHKSGSGLKGISTSSTSAYSQQDGTTTVKVEKQEIMDHSVVPPTTPPTTKEVYVATSLFEENSGKKYKFDLFDNAMSSSFVSDTGVILSTATGTLEFQMDIPGGDPIKLDEISLDFSKVKDINQMFAMIEDKVNSEINAALGTSVEQYVALRPIYEDGTWTTAIYYTSNYDFTISASGGSLQTDLGLDGTKATGVDNGIVKTVVGESMSDLQSKLEDPNKTIVYNVKLAFESSGLLEGTFQLYQDSSMKSQKATKTTITTNVVDIKAPASGQSLLGQKMSATGLLTNSGALDGTITINGVKITLADTDNKSISDIMAIINSSGAGITMSYNATDKKFVLESNQTGPTNISLGGDGDTSSFLDVFKLGHNNGSTKVTGKSEGTIDTTAALDKAGFTYNVVKGVFTINDVPIYVDPAVDSVDDVIKKINNSGAGVKLSYDSVRDKFTMTSDSVKQPKLGSAQDTSDLLMVFGLTPLEKTPLYLGEPGKQAIFTVDGISYNRDSNTITDIIPGVEFNLTGTGTTTLEIDVDTDKGLNAMAKFVQLYNSLMKKLSPDEISKDDRKNKMEALTEEKKESMSEDDLKDYMKDYDSLHTTDMILKSSEVRSLKKSLREMVMSTMIGNESKFKLLSDFGIEIAGAGDYTVTKKGMLVEDSTDLDTIKNALSENSDFMSALRNSSDELYEFFGKYNDSRDSSGAELSDHKDSWASRYEYMLGRYNSSDGIIGNKISADGPLDRKLSSLSKQIESKTEKAEAYLERLWKEFTAMETRIANINSQSQYLAQISGGGSSQQG